jgi:hypothetical protein
MSISHVGSPEGLESLSEQEKQTLWTDAQREVKEPTANVAEQMFAASPSQEVLGEGINPYQRVLLTAADRLRINYAGSNLLNALYDGNIRFESHREAAIVHVLDVLWNDRAKTDRREAIAVLERAAGVTW